MDKLIDPRILKGFRDNLPADEMARQAMVAELTGVFQRYGFLPIDTPALEYAEVLLGKGGGETDKQVYRFMDHGERDVALRFDLTVPFARFMAAHRHELYLPFKRYHIAKVWRGENTQKGRYREFYQCDFDTVGVDATSADLEILLLMGDSLRSLGIEEFRIHLSHRGVFSEFLKRLELQDQGPEILRTVDKAGKIGGEKVAELLTVMTDPERVETILSFIKARDSFEETIDAMAAAVGGETTDIFRLRELRRALVAMELESHYHLDPSITRGLDYYTGIVFETFLTALPQIGSVCSGGRYNNLTTIYSKDPMPGVGASIGLDRLFAALQELDQVQETRSPVDAIILCLDEGLLPTYHRLARRLRAEGLAAEVYPAPIKLSRQFQFAEKKGISHAVICGDDEEKSGRYIVKNLVTRESHEGVTEAELAGTIKER